MKIKRKNSILSLIHLKLECPEKTTIQLFYTFKKNQKFFIYLEIGAARPHLRENVNAPSFQKKKNRFFIFNLL